MTYDDCDRHVYPHGDCDSLALPRHHPLLAQVLPLLQLLAQAECRQFVVSERLQPRLPVVRPFCPREADLEVQYLAANQHQRLDAQDEELRGAVLRRRLLRVFCCGCDHHVFHGDASLLHLEYLGFVLARHPLLVFGAARGLGPLGSNHSLC